MNARLCLGLLLACLQIPAHAQEPAQETLPARITLQEMLRLVAQRSPRLAAERVAIDAAEADRLGAAAYPNPTISIGRFRPAGGARTVFDASSQSQMMLDVPVLLGHRKARVDAAEQAVEAARAHVGVAGHEAAVKAVESFIGLQVAQERTRIIENAAQDVKRLSNVVSERMMGGMASRYEATRAEIELAAMRTRLDDARIEQRARTSELAAMVGAPGWKPTAVGSLDSSGTSFDRATLAAAIKDGNAQIVAARRDEAAALAAVNRARSERVPVPVVSLGRTWTSEPFGAANYIGLSAEIPILDTRTAPVKRAEAELRAAQLRRAALEAELEAELNRAIDMLAARRTTLAQFDRSIGAKLDSLRQMSEDYYQLGRGSILELVDATRSRLESALSGLDVRAQLVGEEMRLLALAGKLPE